MHSASLTVALATATLVIAFSASPAPASAQNGFLFRQPAVSVELRMGRVLQGTDSDIYDFMTENLTLEKKDFAATSFAADAAFRMTERMDLVIGTGYAKSSKLSESRNYVDTDDQPIQQVTSLRRIPVTAGVRLFPFRRGAVIGQYAWIPSSFTPYVGAGGGLMHYRLQQSGDFVDESDLSVFNDALASSGSSVMAYGEAGATYWVTGKVGVMGNARYTWSKAGMRNDYEGFNDIDLRGVQGSAGLAIRF